MKFQRTIFLVILDFQGILSTINTINYSKIYGIKQYISIYLSTLSSLIILFMSRKDNLGVAPLDPLWAWQPWAPWSDYAAENAHGMPGPPGAHGWPMEAGRIHHRKVRQGNNIFKESNAEDEWRFLFCWDHLYFLHDYMDQIPSGYMRVSTGWAWIGSTDWIFRPGCFLIPEHDASFYWNIGIFCQKHWEPIMTHSSIWGLLHTSPTYQWRQVQSSIWSSIWVFPKIGVPPNHPF